MVPVNWLCFTPCFSAATMKNANTGKTAPFMVIDTETLSSGMSLNSVCMSVNVLIGTPAIPTSPTTRGWSES
jgi:hypothetical protein